MRSDKLAENHQLMEYPTMSAQEMLIEEIKHQPESVVREVLRYLKFIEQKRELDAPMDNVVAETWEKLGPAPDVDYDKV